MNRKRPPRFYFSLRSPYSWLAYRDLVDRHRSFAERLEWIPFWEPDDLSLRLLDEAGGEFLYTPMSKAKHLYMLQDVRRLAMARGLKPAWPIDREPWWEVPHLAYIAARGQGKGPEFIELAYRARWEEGRNICDPATVVEFGAALGLEKLDTAVDDALIRAEGVEALLAIFRDGVFGVPFFASGFERFWGVDRLDAFLAATGERQELPPSGAPGTVDDGHASGCG